VIRDFGDGEDRLDVTAFGFASIGAVLAAASQDGGDVVFEFGAGASVVVRDSVVADFGFFDFILV
jgi:hypothetical protein